MELPRTTDCVGPGALSAMKGWHWNRFRGSELALKFNRRDLPHLDRAVGFCKGRTAAVQAGGNLGIYPKRLAMLFQTVYTFEPSAELFLLLMLNAPEPNIVRVQAALGCDRGLVGTCNVRRDGKMNNHEGITHVVPGGTVPTLRIDDLGLPVCDLVYLDIEGYELYALRGAVETLQRCRPVVTVEINKSLGFVGLKPVDVTGFLEAQGYRHALTMGSDQVFVPGEW